MKYNKKDKLTTNYKKKNVLMNVEWVDFYINDSLFKHFNSLPKSQQEAIKQTMILGMLNHK